MKMSVRSNSSYSPLFLQYYFCPVLSSDTFAEIQEIGIVFFGVIALVIEQAMNDKNIACVAQGNGRPEFAEFTFLINGFRQ